jgi:hypothetical protein
MAAVLPQLERARQLPLHPAVPTSFKERGALNALLLLDPESRRKGAIAASAGADAA